MSNLNIKIDLSKVDHKHVFEGKNGAKYLNIILLENRDGISRFGDSHMAIQDIPKELRDAGQRGTILGNAKPFGKAIGQPATTTTHRPASTTQKTVAKEDPNDSWVPPF